MCLSVRGFPVTFLGFRVALKPELLFGWLPDSQVYLKCTLKRSKMCQEKPSVLILGFGFSRTFGYIIPNLGIWQTRPIGLGSRYIKPDLVLLCNHTNETKQYFSFFLLIFVAFHEVSRAKQGQTRFAFDTFLKAVRTSLFYGLIKTLLKQNFYNFILEKRLDSYLISKKCTYVMKRL